MATETWKRSAARDYGHRPSTMQRASRSRPFAVRTALAGGIEDLRAGRDDCRKHHPIWRSSSCHAPTPGTTNVHRHYTQPVLRIVLPAVLSKRRDGWS